MSNLKADERRDRFLVEGSMEDACRVCGLRGIELQPRFLRVVGAPNLGMATLVRWRNFRCLLCEECFRRGAAIVRRRVRAVAIWALAPVVVMIVSFVLFVLVIRAEELLIGILMATALLWMTGFAALPVYLGWLSRTMTPAYLGPDLDQTLRRLAGFRAWGAGRHLVVLREIPEQERAIDLDQAGAS